MNMDQARSWLIWISLAITASLFAFFILSPAFGYPLTFEQSLRLLEIVLPVFLGYLGSATHFVFRTLHKKTQSSPTMSGKVVDLLIRGPVVVFGLASASAIVAFGFSNRTSAAPGIGMTVDSLAAILSLALGLLAVTTNVAVSYLFSARETHRG